MVASKASFLPENTLIISGDPRGGTTWLAETLKNIPDTALLWEPLATSEVQEFRDLGFSWRQYIPESASWPEAEATFRKLFSGQLLSPYLCRSTSPALLTSSRRLMIKFCRANQLLPWLTERFDFVFAPVYLVRHPCAVVASQLKQGGWRHVAPEFEIPTGPFRSFYAEHADFLASIDSVEKRLAAMWCLCNQVPLTHRGNNIRWITVTYESLLQNPEKELKRISHRWKLAFPEELYASAATISTTTVHGSPIRQGNLSDQLGYWTEQLSEKQKSDIFSVLSYFDVSLYDSGVLPRNEFH